MDGTPSLEELTRRLGELAQRQQQFQQEITDLQRAIYELKRKEIADLKSSGVTPPTEKVVEQKQEPIVEKAFPTLDKTPEEVSPPPPPVKVKKERTPIEEFIGTNLLNKIGIAVLVIGIGIGAQYAIDHDLISPLTRIVLGYLCGVVLIGLALRLKPKYQNFSAVLLSGGMAVLYFITFAAYDLYALFPQALAFVLMVLFTAFTVFAALQYNLRVIAIIGLVGAYAVPFLLSDGSGKVIILFSYVTIINIGILVLAFKKYWKQLYYIAFALTWIILAAWYFDQYDVTIHLGIELIFSTIFFATFYTTLLAYKLIRGESLDRWDVLLLLLNSFVYFGFGYDAIESHEQGDLYLGVFTVFNAILHFTACFVIFKRSEQSRDIFYFAAGLVLVFLTLAVPVQLEGNWVTIIWASEAALLFWIGRTKKFTVYEKLSYPLILLAFGSLIQDWNSFYGHYFKDMNETFVRPFLNIQLLSTLLACAAFGFIVKLSLDKKYVSPLKPGSLWDNLLIGAVSCILLMSLYFGLFNEVANLYQQRFTDSQLTIQDYYDEVFLMDFDVIKFKDVWTVNYSALFVTVLAIVNRRWVKHRLLSYLVVGLSTFFLFLFITAGLDTLRGLLLSYVNQTDANYYFRELDHVLIRYVAIAFILPLLWINYSFTRSENFTEVVRKIERVFFHVVIIALLSSELLSVLALLHINDSDKLTLSILWGAYALALIVYGLIKDQKYIRVTAIVLFGITLIKLFFYDLTDMGTIAKTIVMMILGALLLVASFLYNKFKKPTNATPS